MRAFASDNYAPILPEALDAIAAANHGHATSYGADEWTARLQTAVRAHFGDDAVAFPVFNGTGANVVGLRAMLRPWQGVICAESAHLNVDECGAPEVMGGIKLLTVPTPDGKLTPGAGRRAGSCASATSTSSSPAWSRSRSRPSSGRCTRSRSCARCASTRTRTGCCSTSTARGWPTRRPRWTSGSATWPRARTSCRGAGPRSACWRPRPSSCSIRSSLPRCCTCASSRCSWRRRCASCPRSCWRCSTDDVWRRAAGHANAMAARLADGVRDAVPLTQEVRANAVFAILPPGRRRAAAEGLQVLRLGRAHRRGPLDVLLGHDRGGRRRLRRRDR